VIHAAAGNALGGVFTLLGEPQNLLMTLLSTVGMRAVYTAFK